MENHSESTDKLVALRNRFESLSNSTGSSNHFNTETIPTNVLGWILVIW